MKPDLDRNLGEQPIAQIMLEHDLKAHDLVAASTEQITHKMVARACKGRRLTPNVKNKIRNALSLATDSEYTLSDLFNY
jgi:hypothetical protein